MKRTAVVILNWNGCKLLEQFLPPVIEYSNPDTVDIIVADNCSTDDSVDYITKEYPQLKTIILSENYGFAEGYNKALAKLNYEYVVLLNSDVEVTPNWIEPITDYLDTNPAVVSAQPKILSQRNKEYFEYAGAAGGFIDKYGYPFCRGRIFGNLEKDYSQYNTPIDIFWASGACMFIRLKDFKECGGFDGSFFAHMEEIDLCWRLNARGKRLVCIPQSVVYHVGAATLSEESPRKTFLNFRNNLLMLYKNLPDSELKKTFRIRSFLDRLAIIQMFLSGKSSNAKAIIEARKEFKRIMYEYDTARKENLNKTVCPQINTAYPKSILYSFYAKGLKTFSKLRF